MTQSCRVLIQFLSLHAIYLSHCYIASLLHCLSATLPLCYINSLPLSATLSLSYYMAALDDSWLQVCRSSIRMGYGAQMLQLPGLNASQQVAVRAATSQAITLIQGPPGTGKTATAIKILEVSLSLSPVRAPAANSMCVLLLAVILQCLLFLPVPCNTSALCLYDCWFSHFKPLRLLIL